MATETVQIKYLVMWPLIQSQVICGKIIQLQCYNFIIKMSSNVILFDYSMIIHWDLLAAVAIYVFSYYNFQFFFFFYNSSRFGRFTQNNKIYFTHSNLTSLTITITELSLTITEFYLDFLFSFFFEVTFCFSNCFTVGFFFS